MGSWGVPFSFVQMAQFRWKTHIHSTLPGKSVVLQPRSHVVPDQWLDLTERTEELEAAMDVAE